MHLDTPTVTKMTALSALVLLTPLLTSHAGEPRGPHVVTSSRTGMGTRTQVLVYTDDEAAAREATAAAFAEMERVEELMSEWLPDSEVSRLNQSAGKEAVKLSAETFALLAAGKAVATQSAGAFAMSWAALAGLWKFGDAQPALPPQAELDARLPLVGDARLELDAAAGTARLPKAGMALGLGAIAKGYAVDRALAVLAAKGFTNVLVFAGGDIAVRGKKGAQPWSVGIQDPRAAGYFAVLPLGDEAVATSGDYEKFFELDGARYHHILDPRTGRPARGCRSVTIVAPDAMTADAYATAVFVLGPQEGMKLVEADPRLEAIIVDDQNAVTVSKGLAQRVRIVRQPTGSAT